MKGLAEEGQQQQQQVARGDVGHDATGETEIVSGGATSAASASDVEDMVSAINISIMLVSIRMSWVQYVMI